jgi:hypothetical protein
VLVVAELVEAPPILPAPMLPKPGPAAWFEVIRDECLDAEPTSLEKLLESVSSSASIENVFENQIN